MKSIVKHQYIRAAWGGNGHAQAHIRYIAHRPGACERGFFSATKEVVTRRDVYRALEEQNSKGVAIHKVMLSPGTNSCDMREYTREVMNKLSSKLGLDLVWYGVIHRNTEHWHVHVVVMGKDRNGRAVRIDKKSYPTMRECGDRYLCRSRMNEGERRREEKVVDIRPVQPTRTIDQSFEHSNVHSENKDYTLVYTARHGSHRRFALLKNRDREKFEHRVLLGRERKRPFLINRLFRTGLEQRQHYLRSIRTLLSERGKTLARTLRKERQLRETR